MPVLLVLIIPVSLAPLHWWRRGCLLVVVVMVMLGLPGRLLGLLWLPGHHLTLLILLLCHNIPQLMLFFTSPLGLSLSLVTPLRILLPPSPLRAAMSGLVTLMLPPLFLVMRSPVSLWTVVLRLRFCCCRSSELHLHFLWVVYFALLIIQVQGILSPVSMLLLPVSGRSVWLKGSVLGPDNLWVVVNTVMPSGRDILLSVWLLLWL